MKPDAPVTSTEPKRLFSGREGKRSSAMNDRRPITESAPRPRVERRRQAGADLLGFRAPVYIRRLRSARRKATSMEIAIDASRLSGQRLGVGRYLEYMFTYFSELLSTDERVIGYTRSPVDVAHLKLSKSVEF